MAPRRRCPTCGSRQWHKEPSSGLIACSEGHVLQNYRNEVTEIDELGNHALRKRTIKSGRKKKGPESKANPLLYHGARGRYHYFECLQLMLRKQIAALVELWALPQEFEVVCRDIWALHIDLLPHPPSAEPYHYAKEARDEDEGDAVQAAKTDQSEEDSEDEEDETRSNRDDREDEMDKRDEDAELEELVRANSDAESSSDNEDRNELPKPRGSTKGRGRFRKIYEGPASTIAVLIIGCWTLRIPVLCRDLTRLIESYKLPYLDPVQRQLLPRSMVVHLTKHNVQALSPYHAPSTQGLHGLASRLSKLMYTSYGIYTPEANAAPILWRVVSQGLRSTPMLYILTKRLGQILSLPLTLHHTLAPGLEKRRTYDPERHVYDNVPPEVSLMAAGMIVLKLVYGLDGRPRTPKNGRDVACSMARAEDYLSGLEKEKDMESLGDVCTGEMSVEMMDAYLDFSQRVLIGDGDGGRAGDVKGKSVLERFFGLGGQTEGHEGRASETTWRNVEAIIAQEEEDGMRPGEGYRMYRARDVDGTMEREWAAVVERGAHWVGLSVEDMAGVVETYERRLHRWRSRGADVSDS